MKKSAHPLKLGASLCLGVGLIGCQLTPAQVKSTAPVLPVDAVSAGRTDPAVTVPSGVQDFPAITVQPEAATVEGGNVKIAIAWPDRSRGILALPLSANAVRVRIYQDGAADGTPDLVNEILGRDGGVTPGNKEGNYNPSPSPSGGMTSTLTVRKYFLKKNTPYKIEIKAYTENRDAVTDASVPVAYTSAPVAVQVAAKENKAVPIELTVPNPPTLGELPYSSGGPGVQLVLTGTNFGTDASKVAAYFIQGSGDQQYAQQAEVVSANSTSLTIKVNNGQGQGKLRVYVDGIAANEREFTLINQLEVDTAGLLLKSEYVPNQPPKETLYVVKDATFSIPLRGSGWWNGSNFTASNVAATVTAVDKNNVATTVPMSGGYFQFPQGFRKLTFTSGNLTKTLDVEAMTLQFTPPSISTMKLSQSGLGGYQSWQEINLPGVLTTNATNKFTGQVYLRGADYSWSYDNPGVVQRQGEGSDGWADQQSKAQFNPGSAIGSTLVTATLKLDPTKTFSFTAMNVGIDRLVASQASVSVSVNEAVTIPVTIRLTDGTSVDPTTLGWEWGNKFEWTSSSTGIVTAAKRAPQWQYSAGENGHGVITGVAVGNATVNVRLTDSGATTSIPVEVNDDGRLNLTID